MRRHPYAIRLILIPVYQAVMVSAALFLESSSHRWIFGLFILAAVIVPFIGYIATLYQAPLFGKWSRTLKAGVSTLASLIVTIGGYTLLFNAGSWIKGDLGNQSSSTNLSSICACGVTNWSRFSSGRFSVLMPFQPTTSTVTNDTAWGRLVISSFVAEPSRLVAFGVSHNRFPPDMKTSNKQELFNGGLKSALGVDGRLVSERQIQLHGYEGRDWKFEKFNEKAVITMRAYLVDHDFYQVLCVMPKSNSCLRHRREFMDSFDLKDRAKDNSDAKPRHPTDGNVPVVH